MSAGFDVIVIGGGPAGLAAAISATENGARVLLLERESRLGGILKQCIHDGFGLERFGEKLSGPEYAARFISRFDALGVEARLSAFVIGIEETDGVFTVKTTSRAGITRYTARSLVLATGCRERTARQAGINGTRPSGVLTAGTAQRLINVDGVMPAKNCVILGSGDIGLIMARRLTLEGARVLGVYEAKTAPSGLARNIQQCLRDFDIPLHLSSTVTRCLGEGRLEGVEVSRVDENMRPVGAKELLECDALILSVGLIPENELAESLGCELDCATRGPACGDNNMTTRAGVFSCGNSRRVFDIADSVSDDAERAGAAAAAFALDR